MLSENNRLSVIILGAVLFGVYCFVFGQSGILERMRLDAERKMLSAELADLESENRRLDYLYEQYSRGELSIQECENAGYIVPGNRFIFFHSPDDLKSRTPDTSRKIMRSEKSVLTINYMRTGWIILSCLVIIVYYLLIRRKNKSESSNPQQEPQP